MNNLKNTTELVKEVLIAQPKARNSDSYLYYCVISIIGRRNGIDIDAMSIPSFLLNMKQNNMPAWHDVVDLIGWLDLASGDSKYTTYSAKIQESTHVFVCDYQPIPAFISVEDKTVKVSAENARIVANQSAYDVMMIDDPMEMHMQLEFYLQYRGGQ